MRFSPPISPGGKVEHCVLRDACAGFHAHRRVCRRVVRSLRRALAKEYDVAWLDADIQIVDVDLAGDRRLIVQHNVLNRIPLDESNARRTLQHLADLWGYEVMMKEADTQSGEVLKEHRAVARDRIV